MDQNRLHVHRSMWKTWGMTVSQLVIRPRGNNEEWVCEGGRGEVTNKSGEGVMIM